MVPATPNEALWFPNRRFVGLRNAFEMNTFTLAGFSFDPDVHLATARSLSSLDHDDDREASSAQRRATLYVMQHATNYPGAAHMSNHTPILPAQGMADAYRLASLSAGSAHSNGGQPSEAGPSNMQTQSASAGVKRKSNSTANGRKKRASGTEDSGDGQSASAKARDGPKKKKAARACFHCQKAHLTCDDGACRSPAGGVYPNLFEIARPCQRCTKRGMADQCTEGHRKKAKYLLDDGELGKDLYLSNPRPIT